MMMMMRRRRRRRRRRSMTCIAPFHVAMLNARVIKSP
jgi:hypothetical protein